MTATARRTQPRDGDKERVVAVLPKKWQKVIDRAARKANVSRSYYIGKAAYDQAQVDLLSVLKARV